MAAISNKPDIMEDIVKKKQNIKNSFDVFILMAIINI